MPESVTYVSGLNCYLCPRSVPRGHLTSRCCWRRETSELALLASLAGREYD